MSLTLHPTWRGLEGLPSSPRGLEEGTDLRWVGWSPALKVFWLLEVRGRRPLGMMCQHADVTLVA